MNNVMNIDNFNGAPNLEIQRSKFKRTYNHKTTFNIGDLVPIYIDQTVLPGDTFKLNVNAIARLTTPIFPTMDNLFGDIYFFAVPYRLIWDNFKEFMGENEEGAWAQTTEYEIPHYSVYTGVKEGGFHDHAGIPTKVSNITFSQLPRRAYELIYNEWFRDQNVIAPVKIDKGSGDSIFNDDAHDKLFKVSKLHDYFTSALPAPQKGDPISLPLTGNAIVKTNTAQNVDPSTLTNLSIYGPDGIKVSTEPEGNALPMGVGRNGTMIVGNSIDPGYAIGANLSLYADLSNVVSATINQLRYAFQVQRILEKDARGGTRYTEIVKQHFNVDSPDSRQQRPEYLGSKRFTINFEQVPQTSATNEQSPQGNMGAFSLTGIESDEIVKSFTEHTIIMGLVVLRTQQTYQQGLAKPWSKRSRFEFYLPSLANIGEQPILKQEIVAKGTKTDEEVFGYQEAWAEYRMKPNELTGKFRSNAEGTLDSWHYAVNYNDQPVLSQDFLEQGKTEVDRTLTVTSALTDQVIMDVLISEELYRPLPLYSIPGMIDHF